MTRPPDHYSWKAEGIGDLDSAIGGIIPENFADEWDLFIVAHWYEDTADVDETVATLRLTVIHDSQVAAKESRAVVYDALSQEACDLYELLWSREDEDNLVMYAPGVGYLDYASDIVICYDEEKLPDEHRGRAMRAVEVLFPQSVICVVPTTPAQREAYALMGYVDLVPRQNMRPGARWMFRSTALRHGPLRICLQCNNRGFELPCACPSDTKMRLQDYAASMEWAEPTIRDDG